METETDFVDIEDVVEQFLTSRLKVIRARREELEQQLLRRKEILDDILRKGVLENVGRAMAIGNAWKMIVNDKYVIGVDVSNIGEE